MAEQLVRVRIDASTVQVQLDKLQPVLAGLSGSALAQASEKVLDYLHGLGSDVLLGDRVSAPCADGTVEILQPLHLGRGFEDLLSALRAGEVDGV